MLNGGHKDIFETYKELDDNIRTYNGGIHSFEKITILEKNALYADIRVRVTHDNYKVLETRHSDDGELYFCELGEKILVNNSGSIIITRDDYLDIRNLNKNYAKSDNMVRIYLDEYDIDFLGESVEIKTLEPFIPISPVIFENYYENKCINE